jgi:hypothetical protein
MAKEVTKSHQHYYICFKEKVSVYHQNIHKHHFWLYFYFAGYFKKE